MTSDAPDIWYVMLHDEAAAGRIVVPLEPFLKFNRRMKKQLLRLERRMRREIPQLARRAALDRIRRERQPHSPG